MFTRFQNFGQAVIRKFNRLPIDKEETVVLYPRQRVSLPKLIRRKILMGFISKMKSGSHISYFKCNEGVFTQLLTRLAITEHSNDKILDIFAPPNSRVSTGAYLKPAIFPLYVAGLAWPGMWIYI